MDIILCYVTYPDKRNAIDLCNDMLSQKLIACYNIIPIHSGYMWDHVLQNDSEIVSILKTTANCIPLIESYLEKHHPYDIPCLLHWKSGVNSSYGKWVTENTLSPPPDIK